MDEILKNLMKKNSEEFDEILNEFIPKRLNKEGIKIFFGDSDFKHDIEAYNEVILNPVWNLLERGGKRWRPLLMKLSYEAVGGKKGFIEKFLIIPELIHNGTLIIDDIQDCSEFRRGHPCIHKLFGVDISINAGNALYYLPLLVLIKDNSLSFEKKAKIYDSINEEMIRLSFGQGADIFWGKNNKIPGEEQYLHMCANKTGSLAKISVKMGAILGGANKEQINALEKFAEAIGVAFQIQNDINNLISNSVGTDFGGDITGGKKSLMIIKVFEKGSEKDRNRIMEILMSKTNDVETIKEAIRIINKYKSVEYSKRIVEILVEESWKNLDIVLDDSEAKDKLKLFADFLLNNIIK